MQGVVYIDMLVLINAIIGYFLLKYTAFFASREKNTWRICFSAFLAGISACTILVSASNLVLIIIKILFAIFIILTAFKFGNLRIFLKTLFYYVVCNLALGGIVAFFAFCGLENIRIENFSIYIHVSPVLLIAGVLAMYIIIQIVTYFFGSHNPNETAQFKLYLKCETQQFVTGMLLMDNGMRLKDAITNEDAVLCSYTSLKAQLPKECVDNLNDYFINKNLTPPYWLVSVKTATGMRMLPALRADTLTIEARTRKKPIIVFTNEILLDGSCHMLAHPDYLQERK